MRSTAEAHAPGHTAQRWWNAKRGAWWWLTAAMAAGYALITIRFYAGYRLKTSGGRLWGMADDVYISADFARTFAEGAGLTWYPGAPRVEGFSNPLWVLVLAALHKMPGFDENRLGLYVVRINVVIMTLVGVVLVRAIRRASGDAVPTLKTGAMAVLVGLAGSTVLCFCTAIGFETGLVALASILAFSEALAPEEALRLYRIALLVVIGFWTRMDGVLPMIAPLSMLYLRVSERRRLIGPAVVMASGIALQFALRHWYYGDFFPNTYYLKATGWPLWPRLQQGLYFYLSDIHTLVFGAIPAVIVARRDVGPALRPIAVALGTYCLVVLYSVHNGGDLIYAFGADRFIAMAAVLFSFALACTAITLEKKGFERWFYVVIGTVVSTAPIWILDPAGGFRTLCHFLDLRHPPVEKDTLVQTFAQHGKILRQVTKPGARIAVCAAGAPIYFSHRGGVDILGKIEPIVAHEPVPAEAPPEARCWRGFPGAGHNKEDTQAVFDARKPDLSVVVPPKNHMKRYVRFRYKELEFFALKKSPYVEWRDVEILK